MILIIPDHREMNMAHKSRKESDYDDRNFEKYEPETSVDEQMAASLTEKALEEAETALYNIKLAMEHKSSHKLKKAAKTCKQLVWEIEDCISE